MGNTERARRRQAKRERQRRRMREAAGPWRTPGQVPQWLGTRQGFALRELEFGTAQVFGPIEIVPVIRRSIRSDFRVLRRMLEGHPFSARVDADDQPRWLCVPSGVIIDNDDDGRGMASFGAQVLEARRNNVPRARDLARLSRLAARRRSTLLGFLPDHIGRWGFMLFLYGFPGTWEEFGGEALERAHLDWLEGMVPGGRVPGLAEALRVFEIVDGQVGAMVWIAGQLASTLVLPHPDDYRALHSSLLGDWYVQSLVQYAHSWAVVPAHYASGVASQLAQARPRDVAELRALFERMRERGQTVLDHRLEQALAINLWRDDGRDQGPFKHYRVRSDLSRRGANFIGELIEREGRVEYLELMNLNHAQSRRAFLLARLQANSWNLEAVAQVERCSVEQLVTRLANIGIHVHSFEGRRVRFQVWVWD